MIPDFLLQASEKQIELGQTKQHYVEAERKNVDVLNKLEQVSKENEDNKVDTTPTPFPETKACKYTIPQ